MPQNSPVSHYVEGFGAWKLGLVGFFARLRGIVTTLVFTLITMGVPWWWPTALPDEIRIPGKLFLSIIFGVFGLTLLLGGLYLRRRSIRSLSLKHLLHALSHELRDIHSAAFDAATQPKKKKPDLKAEAEHLRRLSNQVCNLVRDYFRRLVEDDSIECAVRLGIASDASNTSQVCYATVGRSSGLNPTRGKSSEAIPANEGIPRFFVNEKGAKGVLIYHDISEAAKVGAFKWTKNEEQFPGEIRTLMVAPLNAWDTKTRSMIGLLYITSRSSSTFHPTFTDSMRAISDLVATTMSVVVDRLIATKRMPSI